MSIFIGGEIKVRFDWEQLGDRLMRNKNFSGVHN
jgi:hypothetical protein